MSAMTGFRSTGVVLAHSLHLCLIFTTLISGTIWFWKKALSRLNKAYAFTESLPRNSHWICTHFFMLSQLQYVSMPTPLAPLVCSQGGLTIYSTLWENGHVAKDVPLVFGRRYHPVPWCLLTTNNRCLEVVGKRFWNKQRISLTIQNLSLKLIWLHL